MREQSYYCHRPLAVVVPVVEKAERPVLPRGLRLALAAPMGLELVVRLALAAPTDPELVARLARVDPRVPVRPGFPRHWQQAVERQVQPKDWQQAVGWQAHPSRQVVARVGLERLDCRQRSRNLLVVHPNRQPVARVERVVPNFQLRRLFPNWLVVERAVPNFRQLDPERTADSSLPEHQLADSSCLRLL